MLKRLIFISFLFFCGVAVDAQSLTAPLTPTPFIPSGTPAFSPANTDIIPKSDIYNFLATAVANVNSLPDNLASPNGTSIIPSETGTQLFGYAKWLFSAQSARELLGNSLSPFAVVIFGYLTMIVITTSVWITVNTIMIIRRVIGYIICLVLKLIPGLG